jgi:hypothetical protein
MRVASLFYIAFFHSACMMGIYNTYVAITSGLPNLGEEALREPRFMNLSADDLTEK